MATATPRLIAQVQELAKDVQNIPQIRNLFRSAPPAVRRAALANLLIYPEVDPVVANLLTLDYELFTGGNEGRLNGLRILTDARVNASQADYLARAGQLDWLMYQIYTHRLDLLQEALTVGDGESELEPETKQALRDRIIKLRDGTRNYLAQAYEHYVVPPGYDEAVGIQPARLFDDLIRYDPELFEQLDLIKFFLDRSDRFWLRARLPDGLLDGLPYRMVVEQKQIMDLIQTTLQVSVGRNLARYILGAT